VAIAKRHLDGRERYVRLREFVNSVGREARERLFGEARFALDWRPEATDREGETAGFAAEMRRRVLSYERSCEVALGIMAAGDTTRRSNGPAPSASCSSRSPALSERTGRTWRFGAISNSTRLFFSSTLVGFVPRPWKTGSS
jgi:hypothetical protein